MLKDEVENIVMLRASPGRYWILDMILHVNLLTCEFKELVHASSTKEKIFVSNKKRLKESIVNKGNCKAWY